MIEILIEKRAAVPLLLGRPGGMRWPPGGIIGGAKDSLFEICRYLRHIMALRCRVLAVDLARPAPPLRCGRRIASRTPPGGLVESIGFEDMM